MYFILSTGRAGSKTLATALQQIPTTVCLHHPKPELAAEATEFFCGAYPRAEIERVLRETRHPTVDGKIYGEVTLQHTLLFPILRDLFPEAQYVWLIRDGRDSVASMYYRGWYEERYPRQSVTWRKARLHGDRTGDFSTAEWEKLKAFERCCWLWKKYNLLIESEMATLDPSLSMQIRLDRAKTDMPKMLTFLGLGAAERTRIEQVNVAKQPVNYWAQWTPWQRSVFEKWCGTEMDRWFPEWRSPAGVWRTLAEAPIDRPSRLQTFYRSGTTTMLKVGRQAARVRSLLAR